MFTYRIDTGPQDKTSIYADCLQGVKTIYPHDEAAGTNNFLISFHANFTLNHVFKITSLPLRPF
jgi:hypothetical protein